MRHLDPLESRRLLDASLVGDILAVTGSSPFSNVGSRMSIFMLSANRVGVIVRPIELSEPIDTSQAFDLAAITAVSVAGNDGEDFIRMEINRRSTLDGGGGPDVLVGGPNDDLLLGGRGPDVLLDRAGNDTVRGGPGNDRFLVGGDPTVSDTVNGDAGNDRVQNFDPADALISVERGL